VSPTPVGLAVYDDTQPPTVPRVVRPAVAVRGVGPDGRGYRPGMTTKSGHDRDWTDAEAEGQPELDAQPPGIDAETASEGTWPPRDRSVGVDEHGVTAAEAAMPETVAERARRERPEVTPREEPDPSGRLVDGVAVDQAGTAGDGEDDDRGLSAEEAAVRAGRG
jgi:hypothetical protein